MVVRGGKRIATGQTAMILSPAIPCVGEPAPRAGYGTRLPLPDTPVSSPEHWKVRADVLASLQAIDPDQRYFLYPVADCEPGTLTDENRADGVTDARKAYAETLQLATGQVPSTWSDAQKAHALSALDRLHSAGLIHGDMHRENVVVAGDGLPRLIDFDKTEIATKKTFAWASKVERDALEKLLAPRSWFSRLIGSRRKTRARRRKTSRRSRA